MLTVAQGPYAGLERFMVAAVPAPQRAMHDISVHRPGKSLHAGEHGEADGDLSSEGDHRQSLGRSGKIANSQILTRHYEL